MQYLKAGGDVYHCQLTVAVICGTGLLGANPFSMNPYVKMALLGVDGAVVSDGETTPLKRGGDNPKFSQDYVCVLPYSAQRNTRMKVQCEVWDHQGVAGDEQLSVGRVDVTEVIGRKRADVYLVVQLRGKESGDKRGTLTISIRSRCVCMCMRACGCARMCTRVQV